MGHVSKRETFFSVIGGEQNRAKRSVYGCIFIRQPEACLQMNGNVFVLCLLNVQMSTISNDISALLDINKNQG